MENCRLSRCSIHQYTVRGSVLCIRILRIFRHSSVACRTCSAIAAVFAGHEKYAAASFPSRSFIYPFRFVLFERLAVFTSACSKPGLNRLFPLSAQYHPRGAVIAFSFLLQPSGSFSSFATFGSPSSEKTSWFFMLFLSFDFLVSTKPRQNPGFNEPRLSIPSSFSSPACFIRRGLRLAAGVQLGAFIALIVKEPCVAMSYQALHSVAGKSIPGRTPKYSGVHSASSSSQGSA